MKATLQLRIKLGATMNRELRRAMMLAGSDNTFVARKFGAAATNEQRAIVYLGTRADRDRLKARRWRAHYRWVRMTRLERAISTAVVGIGPYLLGALGWLKGVKR